MVIFRSQLGRARQQGLPVVRRRMRSLRVSLPVAMVSSQFRRMFAPPGCFADESLAAVQHLVLFVTFVCLTGTDSSRVRCTGRLPSLA